MVCVAGCAVAGQLAVDLGTACLGMFVFLQHQYRRAFAQDKAAAVQVERGGCLCRIALCGQRFHGAETA